MDNLQGGMKLVRSIADGLVFVDSSVLGIEIQEDANPVRFVATNEILLRAPNTTPPLPVGKPALRPRPGRLAPPLPVGKPALRPRP